MSEANKHTEKSLPNEENILDMNQVDDLLADLEVSAGEIPVVEDKTITEESADTVSESAESVAAEEPVSEDTPVAEASVEVPITSESITKDASDTAEPLAPAAEATESDLSEDIPEITDIAMIPTETPEPHSSSEEMSLLDKAKHNARMRRREQTRQRREHGSKAHHGAGALNFDAAFATSDTKTTLIRLAVSAVLVLIGFLLRAGTASFIFLLLAFLVAVIPILATLIRGFTKGNYLNEYLLIFIASLGTFLLGRYHEASIVLILYGIGKLISELVLTRTRKSVEKLTEFVADHAAIVNMQGEERLVKPSEVQIGDFVLIRNGERIPIDGEVLRGEGTIDDTLLTGDAEPIEVNKGSTVLAGSIFSGSLLLVRATACFHDCAVSKILRVNEESLSRHASLENSVTHGFTRLMPFIAIALLLLVVLPPLFKFGTFALWVYRVLTILVVCCPTALLLSIPLSFLSGRGSLSQKGIQVKGNETIEKLAELRMVAFDKTGTLTKGNFRVKEVHTTPDFNAESCLALAAAAEQHSQHPVARAVVAAYQGIPQKTSEFEEFPGRGVRARIGNRNLLVGNRKLMISRGVRGVPDILGTVLYIAYEGDYAGAVVLEDSVRPEAADAIADLKSLGVLRTVILTGDTDLPAQNVAREIGIDTVHSGLLPEEKAAKMEFLLRTIPTDGTAAYVGDGINDLPELTLADVGVAMGVAGSQETADAANVLIMSNNLKRFSDAVRISRQTQGIAMQNMILVLGIKIILVLLTIFGVSSMWQAVSADVLMTILTVLNAARALHAK